MKWLLVKVVWNNFVKGSDAYQLIRKTKLLKQEIKKWKTGKRNEIRPSSWEMVQNLKKAKNKLYVFTHQLWSLDAGQIDGKPITTTGN